MGMIKKFCDGDDGCIFVYEADGDLTADLRAPSAAKMGKKMLAFSKKEEDAGLSFEVCASARSSAHM